MLISPENVRVPQWEVSVVDPDNKDYYMKAINTGGCLRFELRTIINNQKHPTMSGEKFIEAAIAYFDSNRGTYFPTKCVAVLREGTGSYTKFKNEIKKGRSPEESAKLTWWGKTLSKHGFTEVYTGDVTIVENESEYMPNSGFVQIFFSAKSK